jgi:hypothetical protein
MSLPKREVVQLPKPVDIQQALSEAMARLSPLGDDFALIGGVALAAHGIERFTKDVDLATTVTRTAAAERALTDCDIRPLQLGGISLLTTSGVRVDLIDRRFEYRALFEEAIGESKARGMIIRSGAVEVPVVPLHYLVAMKLIADRPQDEADLHALLAKDQLDYRAARDVIFRIVGPYAARRLDKLARVANRKDAPPDYDTPGK